MKISIPEKIKSEIDIIESVYLETAKANAGEQSPAFVGSIISDKHIRALSFIELHNSVFENCTHIQYKIVYKNSITEIIKFESKQQAIYRSKTNTASQQCVRYKTSELFEDSDEGRTKCFEEIDKKILEAESLESISRGDKNLIYYTVFFDKGYVELLNKSVFTILKNSKINFDLLLITDEDTKQKIELQPFVKKLNPKYLLLDTPFDGVEASQYKTRIFEYENINEYNNILFLDCDVICIKDVNNIFNSDIEENHLYTAYSLNMNYSYHKVFNYGFEMLGRDFVEEMRLAKQMPFNAGQFLFKNTNKIEKHFDNLNWFMKNWTGEYFFEQPFMCYYFCKAYLTTNKVLQKYMSIISITKQVEYNITDDTCLLHFITPPLDAKSKLEFIEKFEIDFKLKNSKFRKLLQSLKDNFKYFFCRIKNRIKNLIAPKKPIAVTPKVTAKDLIKVNTDSSYPNTPFGKNKVIETLQDKYKKYLKYKTEPTGSKNLIYYSVAGTKDWVDLIDISLNSVVQYKDVDLDILIITTSNLKNEIVKLECLKDQNVDFHIVPEPVDGVHASMNKLLIYKYKKIKDYNKVLFLDCDTKIVKNLSNIFNISLNVERFYTAWRSFYLNKVNFEAFKEPFHGVGVFSEKDIENCIKNNQRPFNAGQFLFSANERMLKHIENVHWFSKEWPGEYFFEQAFLAHYMCINNLTDPSILDNMVNLYSIDSIDPSCVSIKKLNDENIVIYHFIGKSANIENKLNFIKNFSHANIQTT